MKTICFYFEIHQLFQLKRYRFFDIGSDHYYYDDYANETKMNEIAEKSYIPTIRTLNEMITNSNKEFKVAISISGVAMEQLEMHAPNVIDELQKLGKTGCCEFIAETYSHGLSSLYDEQDFCNEVKRQSKKVTQLFRQTPVTLRNTNLIYSDDIGLAAANMGFKCMLTEGAKHILGWKSPHFVYHCNLAPQLKVLTRDFKMSDDISLRFSNHEWSEFPLFADKYMDWVKDLPQEEQVINLFMNLDTFGIDQPLSSNILDFLKALPECAKSRGIKFATPSEVIKNIPEKGSSPINVSHPISWADEERDVSPWLGNALQREAFNKLYSVAERVRICNDKRIKQDWDYLQASNNFRFMSTKNSGINRGIYDSPYDAFTNYMNILGDFIKRVNTLYPEDMDNEELNSLLTTIKNQGKEISTLQKKIEELTKKEAKAAKKSSDKEVKTKSKSKSNSDK